MKQIKFRAWYSEGNFMAYDGKPYEPDVDYWDGVCCSALDMINSCLKKHDVIFMQYTCQNTNDNKEIYDGDILMGKYQEGYGPEAIRGIIHAVVSWDEEWGKWIATEIGSNDKWDLYDYEYIDTVIGNIYQNPDLLEPQKSDLS